MKKLIAFQFMFIFALVIGVNLMAQTGTPGLLYTPTGTAYEVSKGTATASEIVIPESYESLPVTRIATGSFAFYGGEEGDVNNITSIFLPNSITLKQGSAFYGCSSLSSITIPAGVISIGSMAFRGCSGLTTINVDANNTRYRSEGDCFIEISDNALILGCPASVIPNTVTSIGNGVFMAVVT